MSDSPAPRIVLIRVAVPVVAAACFLLLCPSRGLARWAAPGEAPAVILQKTVEYTVEEDGRYEMTSEQEILIANERGRQRLGTLSWLYNSRAASCRILAAEARAKDRTIPVAPNYIEDKPIASNLSGFDQVNRISVAFPNVELGTRLYLKYRQTQSEVPFPGHFSAAIFAGVDLAVRDLRVVVRSRRPLRTHVCDPTGVLDVSRESRDGFDTVRLSLKGPAYFQLTDEDGAAFVHRDQVPHLIVSTGADYPAMAASVRDAYARVLAEPLPEEFEEAVRAAAGRKEPVDRINAVTSMLADRVRYWADWRPINGGYVPRPLSAIASSRFGDCKDMAVLAAALLRKAGVEADVAWVWRGSPPPSLPPVPVEDAFNHAIVRAAAGGKVFWIDPTNRVSFAQGLPPDLIDRFALVLGADGARLEKIPLPPPEASRFQADAGLDIRAGGDGRLSARVVLAGARAIDLTGSGRFASPETIRHYILQAVSEGRRVVSGTVSGFDADSTVVRDIALDVTAEIEGIGTPATAGISYNVEMSPFKLLKKIDPSKDEGYFSLGGPYSYRGRERLNDARLVGALPGRCAVASPWVDASWEILPDGDGLAVVARYDVKRMVLTRDEVHGREFAEFQKTVRGCFGNYAVVFSPGGKRAAPAPGDESRHHTGSPQEQEGAP